MYNGREEVKSHPIEVLMYSAKHGYSSLANTAAEMTLDLSTTEFLQHVQKYNLNQDIIFQWVCFGFLHGMDASLSLYLVPLS